mgnify:CR=1 FL=1
MIDKIYKFMGLIVKAGKLISGENKCEAAIKASKVYLVIVADDASVNTKKRFSDMCEFRDVNIKIFGERESISRYIGKENRVVVAVTEKEFAKNLLKLINLYAK